VETDRPAGGRWIEVAPERLTGWVGAFADRHGGAEVSVQPDGVIFRAADGAVAHCQVPFPPLAASISTGPGQRLAVQAAGQVAEHALADRTVAVLLVRLGGYAAGVFTGPEPQLVASKVGARLVHGRSAAGGTSQHRFARRREKQAAEALGASADTAVRVFSPYAGKIDAVVLGGDRRTIAGLRPDPRLAPYFGLAVERFLTVPDPRLAVLRTAPRLYRAVRIHLSGPA
jgi:Actinobacteria/chloroflexi VLRF1 release factor